MTLVRGFAASGIEPGGRFHLLAGFFISGI